MLEIILIIALLYLAAGLLFVIPFLLKGLQVVDETTEGSSPGFKFIIIPGLIVFWPVLLKKWLKKSRSLKTEGDTTAQKIKP